MPSRTHAGAFMATFKQLIASAAAELKQADIFCGHGYESAHDEAVALVGHRRRLEGMTTEAIHRLAPADSLVE